MKKPIRGHVVTELAVIPYFRPPGSRHQITFITKYKTGVVKIASYRIHNKTVDMLGQRNYWVCEKKCGHYPDWVPVTSAGGYQRAREWLYSMTEDPSKRP